MRLPRRTALYRCPVSLHRVAAAAALMGAQLGASAQQAETTDATAATEPGKLPTVTVTAERRRENIKDVPSSLSTLSGELLDVINTGGQDVRVLAGRVPSLNIESSFGRAFPRFYIRGYGNTDFRLNASQPVSLVYDDVVQENPILKGFPVFDVDRHRGAARPAGHACSAATRRPAWSSSSRCGRRKNFEGYGSISLGTFSTINVEGALNLPTGAANRPCALSALNQHRDDWVHNTVPTGLTQDFEGYDDSALRVPVAVRAAAMTSARWSTCTCATSTARRGCSAPTSSSPAPTISSPASTSSKISTDGKNEQNLHDHRRQPAPALGPGQTGAVLDHRLRARARRSAAATSTAASARCSRRRPGPGLIPFSSETADGMPEHQQLTQEFRLESSNAGPFNWQGGVYYFHEDYKVESFSYDSLASGSAQNGYERARQKNDAYAAFRRRQLRGRAELQRARRPALHAGQEGLQRRGLQQRRVRHPSRHDRAGRWRATCRRRRRTTRPTGT